MRKVSLGNRGNIDTTIRRPLIGDTIFLTILVGQVAAKYNFHTAVLCHVRVVE